MLVCLFGPGCFDLLVFTYNFYIFTCLQLETAVADEMATLKEEWEAVLDDLETESANLLVSSIFSKHFGF